MVVRDPGGEANRQRNLIISDRKQLLYTFCSFRYEYANMSTKTLGLVRRGWGCEKVGIELGSSDFYPNSIPTGDIPNFCLICDM